MVGSSDLLQVLAGPSLEVAPRLLGAVVHHAGVTVRLTEVEAYAGSDDPGSHAYRSRTPRNEVMSGAAGHLYCYFSYGMHVCANVVCGPTGTANAVLLRAGEVVEGHDLARDRRQCSRDRDLARGPARLCQALAITLDHGGVHLLDGPIRVELGEPLPSDQVATGPRVGLRGAPDRPWRFWIAGDTHVSDYRPAKRLAP